MVLIFKSIVLLIVNFKNFQKSIRELECFYQVLNVVILRKK